MDTQPNTAEIVVPKIRVVFMGTPEFAESILASLIEKQYHLIAIYTRTDKAVGRDQGLLESPVKQLAVKHALPIEQPEVFDDETIEKLKDYKPDLIVVAAYGKILPQSVLDIPGFGCVNIHPSLLPKFRGPSPIQNALLLGEQKTGTTIMLMNNGVDSGDILAQETVAIDPDDTFLTLSEKLAQQSATLLLQTLPLWIKRALTPQKQDSSEVTLCQLIEREDGHILWNNDATSIYNTFRALHPWPGIYSFWNREDKRVLRLKLTRITCQKQSPQTEHKLGEVFELGEKIGVQTSQGVVFLEEVHMEGKTTALIAEFIKGYPQFIGTILQ
jgi:methionyl-tRNA formyltransferase